MKNVNRSSIGIELFLETFCGGNDKIINFLTSFLYFSRKWCQDFVNVVY